MGHIPHTTKLFSGSCFSQPVRNVLSETKELRMKKQLVTNFQGWKVQCGLSIPPKPRRYYFLLYLRDNSDAKLDSFFKCFKIFEINMECFLCCAAEEILQCA